MIASLLLLVLGVSLAWPRGETPVWMTFLGWAFVWLSGVVLEHERKWKKAGRGIEKWTLRD